MKIRNIFIGVLMTLALVGCSSGESMIKPETIEAPYEIEAGITIVPFGNKAEYGTLEVTMNGYKVTNRITGMGKEYFTPADGSTFIATYFTVTNNGEESAKLVDTMNGAWVHDVLLFVEDDIEAGGYEMVDEFGLKGAAHSDSIEPGETKDVAIFFHVDQADAEIEGNYLLSFEKENRIDDTQYYELFVEFK